MNGNIDAGLKAAMKSYANIPDGNDLKLWQGKSGHINYTVTDARRKQVRRRAVLRRKRVGAAITKIGAPGGFEQLLASRAGEKLAGRQPKPVQDGGTDPADPAKAKELQRQISSHVDDYLQKLKDADPASSGEGGAHCQ
jgi:hypothetical protein